MVKPSRSDISGDDATEEGPPARQQKIHEAFARAQPPSHHTPSRSEPDDVPPFPSERQMWHHQDILRSGEPPELVASSIAAGAGMEAAEEYTQSDYYEGLRAVNKELHHSKDTGLIKVMETAGFHYSSRPVGNVAKAISNPAMNDWIPAEGEEEETRVSSKPSRSESNVEYG